VLLTQALIELDATNGPAGGDFQMKIQRVGGTFKGHLKQQFLRLPMNEF